MEPLPPAPPFLRYACPRAGGPVRIDGDIHKPVWQGVPWTDDFVDIEGELKPRPRFRTRAKMLWDDRAFYIAAEMEEPHVWATLTERDSVIFHDNDFEVFLNPTRDSLNYYELEINALNTVWDLLLRKPYRAGGQADNSWDVSGLETAVRVRGTLNDPRDVDHGWDVEIAMPWAAFDAHTSRPGPPRPGDTWKVNFSRVEWDVEIDPSTPSGYRKIPNRREHNWVWSPMGFIDMHLPDRWGEVEFRA
ncbi:MAG: carbohydrate-binding family 9-like protein [Phycisphaeraceae bacterium]|nr:carbohydrate-binding family 9-like protein [Phycisphaeraceae bacterium]